VLPWLIAAIIVFVIVAVIRLATPGPSSGSLTPTTINSTHAVTHATVAVPDATLTEFRDASKALNTANVTVTQALASSSNQPVAQVNQEITPYATALNTFEFDLHAIVWPTSMTVPSQSLTLRIKALASYASSVSTVTPATMSTWVTQFHALATAAQTQDNLVRNDVGLPSTTSFP
jgi:hypothetical protein